MRTLLSLTPLLLLPAALAAQDHAGHTPTPSSSPSAVSPYAELQDREIKALSAADLEALLAGEGMGFALAAELNGYPGPKHVLELAEALELSADQRERAEAVMSEMGAAARELGARLVEAERALDRAFATGSIEPEALGEAAGRIAALSGRLRAVHLRAHLRTVEILSAHQRHRYQELRGYGADHAAGG